jgi:endoglucanase
MSRYGKDMTVGERDLTKRRTWAGFALALLLPGIADAAQCPAQQWPLWQTFAARFIQQDGRVLESSVQPDHSTSEGQSYAMFFAVVANDRERFDKLWRWTSDNLLGSDVDNNLPAWLWGKKKDGSWGVEDANSASDSDLWIAYALLEAGRLWQQPEYTQAARRLLANVEAREIADLPGLGKMLLPGALSFAQEDHLWRLNPSYLPLPLLRRLASEYPEGPWAEIATNTLILLQKSSPKGFVADWIGYRGVAPDAGLFVTDKEKGDVGSYDAIRVYLWAGMTAADDPLASPLLASLSGMANATAVTGIPPETVQVSSGATKGQGPFGFSAALVPYFQANRQPWLAALQQQRAEQALQQALRPESLKAHQPLYYDFMLTLFGLGWADKRYQFLAGGKLQATWETICPRTVEH